MMVNGFECPNTAQQHSDTQLDELARTKIAAMLLELADDELVLGHRDSEWCGYAPILEEDIAFANLALDEIGHAAIWYSLHAELTGGDPQLDPDRWVYLRNPAEFRCTQMVELPNGDWAFSMLRQYLFDAAEQARLEVLAQHSSQPLNEAALKILTEEKYHIQHTAAWVRRLALGTPESHQRTQTALDQLWPYTNQLFIHHGSSDLAPWESNWRGIVQSFLEEIELVIPQADPLRLDRSCHTPYLGPLLDEMQSVARLELPERW